MRVESLDPVEQTACGNPKLVWIHGIWQLDPGMWMRDQSLAYLETRLEDIRHVYRDGYQGGKKMEHGLEI